jgi:hypothetical protein
MEFPEVVSKAWEIECPHTDVVSIWQCKIRNLRKKVKGWSRNREVEIKKSRHNLILELDILDALAKHDTLSEEDQERRESLGLELDKSWRIEESKAW